MTSLVMGQTGLTYLLLSANAAKAITNLLNLTLTPR